MLIRKRQGWEIPESQATPEAVYHDRRRLLKAMGLGGIGIGALAAGLSAGFLTGAPAQAAAPPAPPADPSASLYPAKRDPRYTLDRAITPAAIVTTYNNFYEFGTEKDIYEAAQQLKLRPWSIAIDGMVEKPFTMAIDDLLHVMPLEERLYRHRCVEAWAIAVPWTGFPLKALVERAKPLSSATYVRLQTFLNPKEAPEQNQFWYPWPYTEGLTMAEATNELAFVATGLYGKPALPQNGAPIRLVVPWKYGFKSVKSIVRITFTNERPKTFWEVLGPTEYGFWANVNPTVPHPRWSQATERVLGADKRVPTVIYNGYGEYVAGLYKDIKGEKLFM